MWAKFRNRLWTTPFITFVILGGMLLFIVLAGFELPKAIVSLKWPTIMGVVHASEVRTFLDAELDEGWCPAVSYRYSINSLEYFSEKVEIQDICISDSYYLANQVVERYPVGTSVKVFYNPQNPGDSVLEPGIPRFGLGDLWFIVVLTAAAVGIAFFVLGLLGVLGIVKGNVN